MKKIIDDYGTININKIAKIYFKIFIILPIIALFWSFNISKIIDLNSQTSGKILNISNYCRTNAGSNGGLLNCVINPNPFKFTSEVIYNYVDKNGITQFAKRKLFIPFEQINENKIKFVFKNDTLGQAIFLTPWEYFLLSDYGRALMAIISLTGAALMIENNLRKKSSSTPLE